MPSSTSLASAPTLAIFGPTGGCAVSLLTHALQANYTVSALARTPSKLTKLLLDSGLSSSILDRHLLITQGDGTDLSAVKTTLTAGQQAGNIVPVIVSAIGLPPVFQWSITTPFTLENPNVCKDAARTLSKAVGDLVAEGRQRRSQVKKPLLAFVSTTGVSKPQGPEDVPFLLRFIYHYMGAVMHADKKAMEQTFRPEGRDDGVFRAVVGLRPSMLQGTGDVKDAKGLDKVRVGKEKAPAIGYSICRADVGEWLFREIVERKGEGWEGDMVTLTY